MADAVPLAKATGPSEAANVAPDVVSLSALAPQNRAALRGVAREIVGISRKLGYLSTFR